MTRIAWCSSSRLGELQSFIDRYWGRDHVLARDAELLRWQHPGPEPETISVLVADGPDGEMRGILGIIPVGFCAHGRRHDGAWLTTWVVVPEERSRQLGLRLLRQALAGTHGMVATLGGNETTIRILAALSFHIYPALSRWIRPVSLPALETLVEAAGLEPPAEAWAAWRAASELWPPEASAAPQPVGWSNEVAQAWNHTWSARFAPWLVGTWRDADYLRWRYVEHPRLTYELRFALGDDGEVAGMLGYRRQPVRGADAEVVRVVELLAEGDAGAALASHLLETADEAGAAFVDFYCTSVAFGAPLEAAGFLPEETVGATLPSLFQPLDARRTSLTGAFWASADVGECREGLFAGPDVYFTRSDCDQDRPN